MTEMQEIGTEVPPMAVVVHEPHGFVDLLECNADDLMVVNAARVSFRKKSAWELDGDAQAELDQLLAFIEEKGGLEVADAFFREHGKLHEIDVKVLQFLLKNRHGTPFEHTFFTFHVRAPIFLFREWHRHRIGVSINEESARYVPLQGHFYLPDDEHVRRQTDRPGRYKFESIGAEPSDVSTSGTWGEVARAEMHAAYRDAYRSYERMLGWGIAKELARTVLPVGIYSQMVWTCNARSLMNFLSLRNAETALCELRDYAAVMERMFAEHMPVTAAAFVDNGRIAP